MSSVDTYIHIGHHKTGTTFLQKKIFPQLAVNFVNLPDTRLIIGDKFIPEDYRKTIIDSINFKSSLPLVISSEMYLGKSEGSNNPDWDAKRIANRLKQAYPNAKIIITIRNQIEYIYSIYTHRLLIGGLETHSLNSYLKQIFHERLGEKLKYELLIDHYIKLFGKENILFLSYEEMKENMDDYLQKIMSFLKLTNIVTYKNTNVNYSNRSYLIIQIARFFNRLAKIFLKLFVSSPQKNGNKYNHWLYRYYVFRYVFLVKELLPSRLHSSSKLKIGKKWETVIKNYFHESNKKTQALTGLPLDKYKYP